MAPTAIDDAARLRPTLAERLAAALAGDGPGSSDFDLNPAVTTAQALPRREASVLLAIRGEGDRPRLILTKRSSRLRNHPGQIALPGGKAEPYDADPVATALREAHEEIGLPPDSVAVIGRLPRHDTVTNFAITPIVGMVRGDFVPRAEDGEVDEIFDVPLDHVLDRSRFAVERRLWRGVWRHYYVVPYGPYYIWGATARILRGLAERLAT